MTSEEFRLAREKIHSEIMALAQRTYGSDGVAYIQWYVQENNKLPRWQAAVWRGSVGSMQKIKETQIYTDDYEQIEPLLLARLQGKTKRDGKSPCPHCQGTGSVADE